LTFKDHFSGHAAAYSRHRPRYPEPLFDFVASLAKRRFLAWDCATGNGQSAEPLARRFERVVATDASERQIASAIPVANVEYRVAPAENSGLEGESADLITVSQALHWLDFERFYVEVRRVAAPGAHLAAWAYDLCEVDPAIDEVLRTFYGATVGEYWPRERAWVAERYETIPFPFRALRAPSFHMTALWTADAMLGYVGTWSAVRRYVAARGHDPLSILGPELRRAWGDAPRHVRWPLVLKVAAVTPR
jgi:hypothetical protein